MAENPWRRHDADAEPLAHPDRDPDRDTRPRKAGEHAYTASKLCIMAVVLVRLLNSPVPDLVVATIIALVVVNGASRILRLRGE